jgi:hypothetical protein
MNALLHVGISGSYDYEGRPMKAQIWSVSQPPTEQETVPPSMMARLAWAVESITAQTQALAGTVGTAPGLIHQGSNREDWDIKVVKEGQDGNALFIPRVKYQVTPISDFLNE